MSNPQSPEIEVRNGVTVIQLGPDYDNLGDSLLDDLRDVLLECGRKADPPKIVLDLSHTAFFGSSFLEILLQMWKELSEREGSALALSGLNDNCAEVLSVTQLDSLWKVFATHEEAVKALASL